MTQVLISNNLSVTGSDVLNNGISINQNFLWQRIYEGKVYNISTKMQEIKQFGTKTGTFLRLQITNPIGSAHLAFIYKIVIPNSANVPYFADVIVNPTNKIAASLATVISPHNLRIKTGNKCVMEARWDMSADKYSGDLLDNLYLEPFEGLRLNDDVFILDEGFTIAYQVFLPVAFKAMLKLYIIQEPIKI